MDHLTQTLTKLAHPTLEDGAIAFAELKEGLVKEAMAPWGHSGGHLLRWAQEFQFCGDGSLYKQALQLAKEYTEAQAKMEAIYKSPGPYDQGRRKAELDVQKKVYALEERGARLQYKLISAKLEHEKTMPDGGAVPMKAHRGSKSRKKWKMPKMPKMASAKRDMPSFTKQDRPAKVKEIYRALKRDHPTMPAEMKARIAARQGKKGKQKQGPPYKAPITPWKGDKSKTAAGKLTAALTLGGAALGGGFGGIRSYQKAKGGDMAKDELAKALRKNMDRPLTQKEKDRLLRAMETVRKPGRSGLIGALIGAGAGASAGLGTSHALKGLKGLPRFGKMPKTASWVDRLASKIIAPRGFKLLGKVQKGKRGILDKLLGRSGSKVAIDPKLQAKFGLPAHVTPERLAKHLGEGVKTRGGEAFMHKSMHKSLKKGKGVAGLKSVPIADRLKSGVDAAKEKARELGKKALDVPMKHPLATAGVAGGLYFGGKKLKERKMQQAMAAAQQGYSM